MCLILTIKNGECSQWGGALTNKKIIYIVDDDESVCQALKILLMTFGFEVKTFNSAKSFFAISHDESGCLVLDINMPEVDGWAVLKRVLSSGSKLPIIFISADKYENITDHALKAGAVGFIQKPFDCQTLVDLITVASESNEGIKK